MNPTLDSIVEQALAETEPTNQEVVKDVDESTAEEEAVETNDTTTETKEADEAAESEADETAETSEEADGEEYTADDIVADEEEEVYEEPKVEQPKEAATNLSPEQAYIFNNLPDINVQAADGKYYTIKVPSQLPADFEFANKREEIIFNQNVAAQELNARDLQNQYKTQETQRQGTEFQEKVNASVRSDVAELQREGIFPKFRTPIDSPNFEKDPAAVEMQAVLDLMETRNSGYLEQAQKGQPFRFVGFKEAYDIYTAQQARAERQSNVRKEDSARKTIAKKSSNSAGAYEPNIVKPSVRAGTTTRDLLAEIDAMEF